MTVVASRSTRSSTEQRPPVQIAGGVLDLVDRSRACLLEACHHEDLVERFRSAHLGALRAAAALLAARTSRTARSRPRSAWEMVATIAPELGEWAVYFTDAGRRMQAFDRSATRPSQREADDLIRAAETFLGLVVRALGLPMVAGLDRAVAPSVRR